MSPIHSFILLFILLLFSALFSGTETALFSLTTFQRKRLETRHKKRGELIKRLLESPRRTLITISFGNMLVNIFASSVATSLAIAVFGDVGVGIAIAVMSFALLIFGEVTPKTFAIRNAEWFSLFVVQFVHVFAKIIYPFRSVLLWLTDYFLKIILGTKPTGTPYLTQAELKTLVSIGEQEGVIDRDEREMIHTVFEIGERSCNEIMTPRVDIVACEAGEVELRLTKIMEDSRHNKIPVYEESIDQIIGYISTKEFMLQGGKRWRRLLRPVLFVPEAKKIDDLLRELQAKKMQLAIIVDEYGGTAGLVTLEDILEEVVGEIHDEHDQVELPIERVDARTYRVEGDISLWDLDDDLGIDLDNEEVETLGGFILSLVGRIPSIGEKIPFGNYVFEIEEVSRHRIRKILIHRKEAKDSPPGPEEGAV